MRECQIIPPWELLTILDTWFYFTGQRITLPILIGKNLVDGLSLKLHSLLDIQTMMVTYFTSVLMVLRVQFKP